MTVNELIKQLEKLPQHLDVMYLDSNKNSNFFGMWEIINVDEITTNINERYVVIDCGNFLNQDEGNQN